MMVVSRGGREAVTIFHVRDKFERYTLLDAEPKTGRTHQIRVHLAFIGHPVVGDETYGHRSDLIARQFLHAWNLAFDLPRTHARVEFTAPRPRDLREALVGLGSRFEV
jgi:23S rRNA pseudouridine1911/1915/1917 synthase